MVSFTGGFFHAQGNVLLYVQEQLNILKVQTEELATKIGEFTGIKEDSEPTATQEPEPEPESEPEVKSSPFPDQPPSLAVVASLPRSVLLQTPHDVAVVENYAYVAAKNAHRLTVVDVADPKNPEVVGTLTDAKKDSSLTLLSFAAKIIPIVSLLNFMLVNNSN